MPSGYSYLGKDIQKLFYWAKSTNKTRPFSDLHSKTILAKDMLENMDNETHAMLHDMAMAEGVKPKQFALDLLTYTIRLHFHQNDERISLWKTLTPREQEVAALACQGKSNLAIARILNISKETVKTHMSNVLKKFDVKGRKVLKWELDGWNFNVPENPWR